MFTKIHIYFYTIVSILNSFLASQDAQEDEDEDEDEDENDNDDDDGGRNKFQRTKYQRTKYQVICWYFVRPIIIIIIIIIILIRKIFRISEKFQIFEKTSDFRKIFRFLGNFQIFKKI